jgi:hypothetical protein
MAIYLGGLLAGFTCGWLVIRTTFFADATEKAGAVRLWGFRGPMGAWVTIWGALAMVTSAPFDNWWHDAYGVDVKILSPPHTVLALGMWGVVLGALLLILKEQNLAATEEHPDQTVKTVDLRAASSDTLLKRGVDESGIKLDKVSDKAADARSSELLYIYAAGILVVMASVFLIEYSWPNQHRTRIFYEVSAATFPMYLMWLARGSKMRWAATWIALVYMGISVVMGWVLPLFPGQPRLGPIYNQVTHFVALPFPLLLVVPAFGMDLVRHGIGHGRGWVRDWLIAVLAGIAFVVLFMVTQWFFSAFLLSEHANNWFFIVKNHWGYREGLGDWRHRFWSETYPRWNSPMTVTGAFIALVLALASSRAGLWLGNWMAKVKR